MKTLVDAARDYRRRGWSVIPVMDKVAVGGWKRFQAAPPDPGSLSRIFSRSDINGIAVVMGPVSGWLAVRDFDVSGAYESWAGDHPDLADVLPTVRTGRGHQIYHQAKKEMYVTLTDGEYRGDSKHYCVVPPSLHPSGVTYTWTVPLPDGPLPVVDSSVFLTGECNRGDRSDKEDSQSPQSPQFPLLHSPEMTEIITKTLPTLQGQRHKRIFKLARYLKSIGSLANAEFATLRPILQEWHRQALPIIRTKDFAETWADFLESWKAVKVPVGDGVIDVAFERALTSPAPRQVVEVYGLGAVALLASLCRELQRIADKDEFYLDCRGAGDLLGISHVSAWRFLNILCADGVLIPGTKGSMATMKASRFRYIGDRDPRELVSGSGLC